MTQIGKDPKRPITEEQERRLELYKLAPHPYPAEKTGETRTLADGTEYFTTGRGWRKIPKTEL